MSVDALSIMLSMIPRGVFAIYETMEQLSIPERNPRAHGLPMLSVGAVQAFKHITHLVYHGLGCVGLNGIIVLSCMP